MSTTTNFKISIKNQTFIVLGGLKCEKLANNVIKVTNKGLGTCFSKKVSKSDHFLADRLLLLKRYDIKMVKLPGCSSIGASS